jgi:two-component system response regulator HydG
MLGKILTIDDDQEFSEELNRQLRQAGHETACLGEAEVGLRRLAGEAFDLVLVDNRMPRMSGLEFLDALKDQIKAAPPVILMTGALDADTAILATKKGAFGYVIKPLDQDAILPAMNDEIQRALKIGRPIAPVPIPKPDEKAIKEGLHIIIGQSRPMLELYRQIGSQEDESVLILGETGTGKELIAQAIHTNSARKGHTMVAINCGALTDNLLEDELFGHEKGAFTGADKMRKGYFEHATGGTVFLDEVGDMPPKLQVKLLRVLEAREITRMGSNEPIKVDVRVLAATSLKLAKLVEDGKFREDLYFRLEHTILRMPALRERKEDIQPLAEHFLKQLCAGEMPPALHPDALRELQNYPWPGNIRSLRNVMRRARQAVRKRRGAEIVPEDLNFGILDLNEPACLPPLADSDQQGACDAIRRAIAWVWRNRGDRKPYPLLVELLERELLDYALGQPHTSETELADLIGVVKNTVRTWKKEYGKTKPADNAD